MRGYRFSCTRQELTRQALRRECQSPLSTHQGPAAVPPPPLVARPARRRSLGSSAADIGVVEVTLCLPERKRAEAALYWDTELHVDEGQISTRGGKMHRHTCSAVRCTGTPGAQLRNRGAAPAAARWLAPSPVWCRPPAEAPSRLRGRGRACHYRCTCLSRRLASDCLRLQAHQLNLSHVGAGKCAKSRRLASGCLRLQAHQANL